MNLVCKFLYFIQLSRSKPEEKNRDCLFPPGRSNRLSFYIDYQVVLFRVGQNTFEKYLLTDLVIDIVTYMLD